MIANKQRGHADGSTAYRICDFPLKCHEDMLHSMNMGEPMSKKLFTRRSFTGLAAVTTISFFTGCDKVMKQVLNGSGQDDGKGSSQTQGKNQEDEKERVLAAWNATPFVEKPDNPTLDGDINKIIVGVWQIDTATGAGDKAGKTYDHAGMLNQAYHDGTVPHYIFKSDGTHELHHFDGKVDHGKWTAKGDSAISCVYEEDGTTDEWSYDREAQRLKFEGKSAISSYQKLSDNPKDTSQIAYIDGNVVNFAATIPGVWELVSLHRINSNEPDLSTEDVKSNIKKTGTSYFFSVHKNGFCALFYPSGRVLPGRIEAESSSDDKQTYPMLVAASDQFENVEEASLQAHPKRPTTVYVKLKEVELLFQHVNHREDDFGDISYAPKASFPWHLDKLGNPTSESSGDNSSSSKSDISGNK